MSNVDINWKAVVVLVALVGFFAIFCAYAAARDPALTDYTTHVATLEKLDRIIELLTQIKEKTH